MDLGAKIQRRGLDLQRRMEKKFPRYKLGRDKDIDRELKVLRIESRLCGVFCSTGKIEQKTLELGNFHGSFRIYDRLSEMP